MKKSIKSLYFELPPLQHNPFTKRRLVVTKKLGNPILILEKYSEKLDILGKLETTGLIKVRVPHEQEIIEVTDIRLLKDLIKLIGFLSGEFFTDIEEFHKMRPLLIRRFERSMKAGFYGKEPEL